MSRSTEAAFADRPLCNAPTKSGGSCLNHAMRNSTRCRSHGGNTPAAIDAARVRALRQADPLMAKLHAIAFDDNMPPQVQLEAIKHALKVTGAFEAKQTIQVDVGTNEPKSFEAFVGEAVIDVEEEDWDESPRALPAAPGDMDVVDADIIEEPQLMNRHDRLAFAEVDREKRRAPVGLTRNSDAQAAYEAIRVEQEAEALSQAGSFEKERRYREAYARLMGTGTPREVAEREAQRYADAPPEPDRPRRRRTRSSEARYSR